jgi:hypothetical protein
VAWHDELTELATAERDEIAGLADLAEDVVVVELPLLPSTSTTSTGWSGSPIGS